MNTTLSDEENDAPQPRRGSRATLPDTPKKGRAKSETPIALEAYGVYERLGPQRSFPAAAKALIEKDPQHYRGTIATLTRRLKQWAKDHEWSTRVREYDLAVEQAKRDQIEQALARMNEEQALEALIAQRDVFKRLRQLRDIDQGAINAVLAIQDLLAQKQPVPKSLLMRAKLKPSLAVPSHVLAAHLRDLIDVERLARGAATEIAQQQHAGGIRISIITAPSDQSLDDARDGRAPALTSPFAQDPNALLAADESGYTADDDVEDESADEIADEEESE